MSTLAERLKLLVSLVDDLSLRELGRLIGVSETYPGLIASGERPKIRSDIAAGIAGLFGTTIDFVLAGVGEPPTRERAVSAVAEVRAKYAAAHPKTDPPPPPVEDEGPKSGSHSSAWPTGTEPR